MAERSQEISESTPPPCEWIYAGRTHQVDVTVVSDT